MSQMESASFTAQETLSLCWCTPLKSTTPLVQRKATEQRVLTSSRLMLTLFWYKYKYWLMQMRQGFWGWRQTIKIQPVWFSASNPQLACCFSVNSAAAGGGCGRKMSSGDSWHFNGMINIKSKHTKRKCHKGLAEEAWNAYRCQSTVLHKSCSDNF